MSNSIPKWLADRKILDRLAKGGRRPRPGSAPLTDRGEQWRRGVKAADPNVDSVYFTNASGASFVIDEGAEIPAELLENITIQLRYAETRAEAAAVLRRVADELDPVPSARRGRPEASRDNTVIGAIYRERLRQNQELRQKVLLQDTRPSAGDLRYLASRRAVFTSEDGQRVTIAEPDWPSLESLDYAAGSQGIGSDRTRKILPPLK
jgi:hypothetical protein